MKRQQHAAWRPSLVALCVLSLAAHPGFPCSMIRGAPEAIRAQHYVFEGVVRAIVAPREPAYLARKGWGLSIEVERVVQAPHQLGSSVEMYPFDGYSASCAWLGLRRETLEKKFPVGTKLRVAATAYPASQRETDGLPDRLYSEEPLHMHKL